MKKTEINNIRTNIMGTVSFDMKAEGWRKFQDFIVYPKSKDNTDKSITIQSSKVYGIIDLETGKGTITKSFPNGAYSMNYMYEKAYGRLIEIQINDIDCQTLRMKVFTTAGSLVGNSFVKSDNSGAVNVL